ncbi:MAG: P-II family nitrogen regulator [Alphaproteobacteria bacterium]
MKMVWAVIRSSSVDAVTRTLKTIGVSGCAVSRVRGYGEEWHLYEPLVHGGHHKLELIVADEMAEKVASQIAENVWTGLKGDGVVSVFDLGKFIKIRMKDYRPTEAES